MDISGPLQKRTERERIADRRVTGVFSGSYAVSPFTGDAVPYGLATMYWPDMVRKRYHGSSCP